MAHERAPRPAPYPERMERSEERHEMLHPDKESNAAEKEVRRERIMAEYGKARGQRFREIIGYVPVAGGVANVVEAATGRAFEKELSGKERLIHAGVGVGSLALDASGIGEAGRGALVAGRGVLLLEKSAAKLAARGMGKMSRIMRRTAQFAKDHPVITERAEAYFEKKILENADFIRNYQKNIGRAPER